MKRAIFTIFFALCFALPASGAAQCPTCTDSLASTPSPGTTKSGLADPARIIVNDKKNFGIRIGSDQYANQWAYRRLGDTHEQRWRNRRVSSGAIIATGGIIAYAGLQVATAWFVTWAALGAFGELPDDPWFLSVGVLSVVGMFGGGALVYYGATRSKHPYSPDERLGIVDEFNAGRH